jgi:cell wall-associated NlpC family hydrolase
LKKWPVMARKQLRLGSMAQGVWLRAHSKRARPVALGFLAALSIGAATLTTAHAQTARTSCANDFAVALQPFSLDQPTQARYAYYASRAIPRAEAVTEPEQSEPARPAQTFSGPVVRGKRAVLRNGVAYAPANAPDNVKHAIWAANKLSGKPYVWGGGHGSFDDYGYDCSGTVSFALHHAGLLDVPLPSGDFLGYGKRGRGKWITVYARHGHTFAVIAGLRLDTTDLRYGTDIGPRWHSDPRDPRGFAARHPEGL